MAQVSIKDIAKRLGISAVTVSLVLNGKDKSGRLSEALAKKNRTEVKTMQYEPNSFARSLRSCHFGTIGLIVADISNLFVLTRATRLSCPIKPFHLFGNLFLKREKAWSFYLINKYRNQLTAVTVLSYKQKYKINF